MSDCGNDKQKSIAAQLSRWLRGLYGHFAANFRSVRRGVLPLTCLFAVTAFYAAPASANHTSARTVGVKVSAPTVAEQGGGSASFQLYHGTRCASGTVTYTITGTATNGTDYNSITSSGSVAYSCAAAQTVATVVPIDDALMEANETVTFNITGWTCSALRCGVISSSATITIIDDDTPSISLAATDAAASETGPDTGTFTITSNKPLASPTTVNLTATGTATLTTDYTLSGGVGSNVITQTSDGDFNAGTLSNAVVGAGSVGLLPTSSVYSPPSDTTIGAQQLYGTGSSATNQGFAPYIFALPAGGYRLYYSWHNGSFWQLAYKDTTDLNVPTSANLGAQTLLGVGTAGVGQAIDTFNVSVLPGGTYRMYYAYYNGTAWQLAYRDTTDTNPPNAANLGAQTLLGLSGTSHDLYASIFAMPGGIYRLYFSQYTGTYWRMGYRDTTDTNLPNSTNLTAPVFMLGTSTTNQALAGAVVPLASGAYRLYVPVSIGGASNWQIAYRDTTDFNPPNAANLGAQVLLGVGGASSNRAYALQVFKMPNLQYRLNYGHYNGTYWQAVYRDGAGVNTYNTAGTLTSSVLDLLAIQSPTTLSYTSTLPAATTLTVDARAGDSAIPDGTWTAWLPGIASGGSIAALGSHRYVQYRANFSTADTAVTPLLHDMTLLYTVGAASVDTTLMQVVLPAGSTSTTINLTPVDDTVDEYAETAILTLASGTGYLLDLFSPVNATVTIADNDLNAVSVVTAANGAEQGGVPGSFTISRTGIRDLPLTVNYTVSGTATAGSDYTALSGTVTIPASSGIGTNSATVSFTPINDALIEGPESIVVTLSANAAYSLGAANTATANIIDNDTDGTSRADTSGIFLQSDWATTAPTDALSCTTYGGTWTGSACIGIHTDNQNSWTTFGSAGSGLDTAGTPGQVTEVPTPQQWLQTDDGTSDRGFRTNGSSTTGFATVSGFDDAADVTLAPIDVGDGSDGAFNSATYNGVSIPGISGTSPSIAIDTNEATHQGVYNFTDFKVAAGDTITVTGSHPLKLYVLVDTKIDGTLSASASGRSGYAGGGNGGNGANDGVGVGPAGVGGGGIADPGNLSAGGGGGGHGAAGADGTSPDAVTYPPGLGGEAYGDDTLSSLFGGSGGGGNYITGDLKDCSHSNPTGGGGGGVIVIQSGASISITGQVAANGAAGSNYYHRSAFGSCGGYTKGPGGGGAGGSIKLVATNIVLVDGGTRLSAVGGSGGYQNSLKRGGDGGGGRIRLESNNLLGVANANAGTGTKTTVALATSFINAGSGTYTSHVQYMGNVNGTVASPGVWSTLSWTEDLPTGTTLTVSVHSCATSDCSDRAVGDWSPVVNGQDISTLSFVDDAHAYIQYKVDMTTAGGALPRLHDLAINTISYGGGVWLQTNDGTTDTGFNKTGFVISNTLVVGNADSASIILNGLAAGTGADGGFDSASYDGSSIPGITGVAPNVTIDTDEVSHGGVYNFSSFTIGQGDTVRVKGGNPFILKSLGNVTVNGALNAKGYSGDSSGLNGVAGPGGGAGGPGCTSGSGLGAGGGVAAGNSAGGGGGGHASVGSAGETSYTVVGGAGGLVYGDSALPSLEGGSGGGGSAAPSGACANAAGGGGGGGSIEIISGDSLIVGTVGLISVDGGAGGSRAYSAIYAGGGGGGGSAGSLDLDADQIILNNPGASLSARGGQGGSSYFFADGGAGGDGRIDLTAVSIQGSASINVGSGSLVTQSPASATPVSGSFVSAIYDAGSPVSWDPVYWVESVPTGSTVTVSLHSCAVADCSDRGPSDWSAASNTQDISSLAYVDDGHQYIQYRVDMTSDGLVPRLDSIAVNFKQDMGGSALVSSVYDTQDNANQIVALLWTADTSGPGTAVKFQLRTSPDGVTWTPWYGPTGTTDYYTVSGSTINPVHADGTGDRYVQYKAVLINTNPEYTPILQDVTLKYITYGSGAVVGSGSSFGSGAASNNLVATGSSGGGGALGTVFFVILLLGTALSVRRSPRLGLKGVVLLALTGTTMTANAAFVLNFSAANPVSGGAYKTFTVGDINSDFYQEFIIQKGFGLWQGDTGTASGGSRANSTDPLGFGGTALSGTGNATGNPSKVIIWQRNRSSDMLLDFLKDDFGKKPRIMQTVITNDMLSEFSVDMRGLSYSDNTTVAPVINTLTVSGQTTYPAQSATWDMATGSQNSHLDAGLYTYTPGSGPGGSIGAYNFNEGNFPVYSTDWSTFFDKTDPSNVWTNSANKPK